MASKNIITPWSFRDGRDYVIALSVGEAPNASISIRVSDKITAEEWSCCYDSKYVEGLTQRTGNYKKFDVFVSMLKSAILKRSESVALEMMNIDDLEILRAQKQQSVGTIGSNEIEQISSTTSHFSQLREFGDKSLNVISSNSKKKYLIVTYVAEFDKVHYPIPLNYSGPPDPQIMQNSIRKLQSEVSSLRNTKSALEEEVITLRQERALNPQNDTKSVNTNNLQPLQSIKLHEVAVGISSNHYTHHHHPEDETKIQNLMSIIRKLEERISLQETDHHEKISKLQAQFESIGRKLEGVEKYNSELEIEIHHLKTQLLVADEKLQRYESQMRTNARRSDHTYYNNTNSRRGYHNNHNNRYNFNYRDVTDQPEYRRSMKVSNCRVRDNSAESFCGSSKNYKLSSQARRDSIYDRSKNGKTSNNVISSPQRQRSISPANGRRTVDRRYSDGFQPRIRSRSSSPARPNFDPTAYVAEKKLKQEKMAQLRLDNIRSRLRERSSSIERNARSRSTSTDSSAGSRITVTLKYGTSPVCSLCGTDCRGHCFRKRRVTQNKYISNRTQSRSPSPHGTIGRTSLHGHYVQRKSSSLSDLNSGGESQRPRIAGRPCTPLPPRHTRADSNVNVSHFPNEEKSSLANLNKTEGGRQNEDFSETDFSEAKAININDGDIVRKPSNITSALMLPSNAKPESSHGSKPSVSNFQSRKTNSKTNNNITSTKTFRKGYRNSNTQGQDSHTAPRDRKSARSVELQSKLRDIHAFLDRKQYTVEGNE